MANEAAKEADVLVTLSERVAAAVVHYGTRTVPLIIVLCVIATGACTPVTLLANARCPRASSCAHVDALPFELVRTFMLVVWRRATRVAAHRQPTRVVCVACKCNFVTDVRWHSSEHHHSARAGHSALTQ